MHSPRSQREIIANAGWIIAEQLVRLVGSTIAIGLMARAIGPEAFGLLTDAQNWLLILAPLASLGIGETIVRQLLIRGEGSAGPILRTAIQLRFFAGLLIAVGALIQLQLLVSETDRALYTIIICALPCLAPQALEQYFQARLEAKSVAIYRTIAVALTSIFRIALAYHAAPLVWFAVSILIDYAAAAIALVWAAPPWLRRGLLLRPSTEEARQMLKISWPLAVSSVIVVAYFRAEQFVIAEYLGKASLGSYSAAARIVGIANIFSTAILSSVLPVILSNYNSSMPSKGVSPKATIPHDFIRLLEAMMLLGILTAIMVSSVGPAILTLLFGPQYDEARVVLALLAVNIPILLSGAVRSQFMLAKGCTHIHIWAASIGLLANVAVAIVAIQNWGVVGAVLASTSSAFLSSVGTSFMFAELRSFGKEQLYAFLIPFKWKAVAKIACEIRENGLFKTLRKV
jgi:O-antigen/teichoic acid export membrane protein